MGVMKTLAQRVAFAREKSKLTQAQIAQRSGLKQSDVSKIERGSVIKTTGLVGLARAMGCNPFWLENGKGDPFAPPGWPWTLFDRNEYEMLDEDYRRRVENDVYGEIARQKKLRRPNGSTGP